MTDLWTHNSDRDEKIRKKAIQMLELRVFGRNNTTSTHRCTPLKVEKTQRMRTRRTSCTRTATRSLATTNSAVQQTKKQRRNCFREPIYTHDELTNAPDI